MRSSAAHRRVRSRHRATSPQTSKADRRVGVAGFEPATFWSRTKRASKLRYTPLGWVDCIGSSSLDGLVLHLELIGLGVVVLHDLSAYALAQVRPPVRLDRRGPRVPLVRLRHDANDDRPLIRFTELEAQACELLGPIGGLEPLRRCHDDGRRGPAAAARVAPAVDGGFGIEAAVPQSRQKLLEHRARVAVESVEDPGRLFVGELRHGHKGGFRSRSVRAGDSVSPSAAATSSPQGTHAPAGARPTAACILMRRSRRSYECPQSITCPSAMIGGRVAWTLPSRAVIQTKVGLMAYLALAWAALLPPQRRHSRGSASSVS